MENGCLGSDRGDLLLKRILTTESEIRKKVIKDGLRVGKKVKIPYIECFRGIKAKGVRDGVVIALYPHIFVVVIQSKVKRKVKRKECFQYKQILLGEVRLCQ